MTISAVILAKNEEKNIKRALDSVDFADEVIVIDDESEDKTAEIAKKTGATVYKRKLNDDFAAQHNFGLEKAKGDWVLFLDADEEVTSELQQEIKNALSNHHPRGGVGAYYLKRRDFFWNQEVKYGEVSKAYNQGFLRLVRKGSGEWQGKVHEAFKLEQKLHNISSRLTSYINHYPHPTIKEFLQKISLYSSMRAKELLKLNKKASILEILFWPPGKFITNYFLKLGFLDGAAGFVYAFLMSFHSFLVRAKLYQYTEIDS